VNAEVLGAPILGVFGDEENLYGDPIPPPNYIQEEYSAIVRDKNLWDTIVQEEKPVEQKKETETQVQQVVIKERFKEN